MPKSRTGRKRQIEECVASVPAKKRCTHESSHVSDIIFKEEFDGFEDSFPKSADTSGNKHLISIQHTFTCQQLSHIPCFNWTTQRMQLLKGITHPFYASLNTEKDALFTNRHQPKAIRRHSKICFVENLLFLSLVRFQARLLLGFGFSCWHQCELCIQKRCFVGRVLVYEFCRF